MVENVNFRLIEEDYSNDGEYEKFVEYYNQGMTYAELIKSKDISTGKLRKLLKEATAKGDIVPRKSKNHEKFVFDDSTYYKFLELYSDEEWTYKKIKKELNLSMRAVEEYRKQGVKDNLITENRQQMFYNQRVIKYYPQIIGMLKTGQLVGTISRELNLPYTFVKRMREKAISEGDI